MDPAPKAAVPAPKSSSPNILVGLLQSVGEQDAIAIIEGLVSFYTTGSGTIALASPISILGKSLSSITFA